VASAKLEDHTAIMLMAVLFQLGLLTILGYKSNAGDQFRDLFIYTNHGYLSYVKYSIFS